jgi:hypothetical protein
MPPFFALPTDGPPEIDEDGLTLMLSDALRRDRELRRGVCRLFGFKLPFAEPHGDGAEPYLEAIDSADELRIDFHRALRAKDTDRRVHWPDLTVSASHNGLPAAQLVVEVKLSSALGVRRGPTPRHPAESQMVSYARAWRERTSADEAPVRRMGTLTVGHLARSVDVRADAAWIGAVRKLSRGVTLHPSSSSVRWLDVSILLEDAAVRLCKARQRADAMACAGLVEIIRQLALPLPKATYGAPANVVPEADRCQLLRLFALRHRAACAKALGAHGSHAVAVRTPWAEADQKVADTMLAAIDDLPRRAILMAYGGDLDPQRNTSEIAAKFGSRGNYRVERDRGLRQIISQALPVEAPRPSSLL